MIQKSDGSRISKILARSGIASRRQSELIVLAGRVAINGHQILSPALNVMANDIITIDGKPVPSQSRTTLWKHYKRRGLVTTHNDERGRMTVFDDLPSDIGRVMSIGRLDINSEGLMLLTNDGDFKRWIELPSTQWMRIYRVRAQGKPSEKTLNYLRAGPRIENEQFRPMSVTIDRQMNSNLWMTIGISEGRNREIRRALEQVGMRVSRLIRISFGPFNIDNLKPGMTIKIKSKLVHYKAKSFFMDHRKNT